MGKLFDSFAEYDVQAERDKYRDEGRQEDKQDMNGLIIWLTDEGRVDDLIRSAHDPEYQKQLIEEMMVKTAVTG